jgi:membrane-bound acyltransferase YfiQ involved in biofilm formation
LLLSSLSCLLLLWSRLRSETLAWIGGFSYTIYLLHVFFTAAIRIALNAVHVSDLPVHLAAGVAAGIFLPIAMDKLLSRNQITRVAMLGRR